MDKKIYLSFGQKRLFFVDQTLSKKSLFNIPVALRLRGNLDILYLTHAFKKLLERHEILRLNVQQTTDDIHGVISNNYPNIEIIDYTKTNNLIKESIILDYINQESKKDFDLVNDKLVRIRLLILNEDEFIVFLVFHHIIADEWSINIMIRDLEVFYYSNKNNTSDNLLKLPIQYSDYALIQHSIIDSDNHHNKALRYWQQYLNGAPESLSLPHMKLRPEKLSYSGKSYKVKLSFNQLLKLKNYAISKKTTIFVLLLALFKYFLHRYTGEKDIVIGYPSANRLQKETEELVGLFVNLIPIRSIFNGNMTFEDCINKTKGSLVDSYEFQDYPFEKLVQNLSVNRKINRHPIFQVLFTLHGKYIEKNYFEEFDPQYIEVETNLAKFDLALHCVEELDGLLIKTLYSDELFDNIVIQNLIDNFVNTINITLENDKKQIKFIPLLTSQEKVQLLVDLNNKTNLYPYQGLRLEKMFSNQAKLTPNNIAIITAGNNRYTFAEIDRLSNKFANYLIKHGIDSNSKIAIAIEASMKLIICILGVLKIGGTYVPISSEYPKEKIDQILTDSGAVIMIKDSILEKINNIKTIDVNQEWYTIIAQSKKLINSSIKSNDIACIIYTSGSTGQPKGILYRHNGVCNRVIWINKVYPFSSNETCILLSNITFVDFFTELFIPLLSGIKVVLAKTQTNRDPDLLIDYLNQYKISRINLVPSLLRVLLEHNYLTNLLPYLKHWEISGELFPENLMISALKKLNQVTLINRYGSSEATSVIYNELHLRNNQILINTKIVDNTIILICDEYSNPMPWGFIGEINVIGAPLSAGYLNDISLTKDKFRKLNLAPFNNIAYKTGDLGHITPEGNIIIIGRKDHQIKFNGYRIDPNEIAEVLEKYPSVKQAIVMHDQKNDISKLLAYFTVNDINNIDLEELRIHIKKFLPSYMIPTHLIPLNKFSYGKNGKIDYQVLETTFFNSTNNDNAIKYKINHVSLPKTALELKLIKIWQDILRVKNINIQDNFFRLGGHSLLLIKLIAEIKKQLDIKLSINFLYENPTIEGIIKFNNKKLKNNLMTLKAFCKSQNYLNLFLSSYINVPCIANRYSYFLKRKRNLEFWNVCLTVERNDFIDKNALFQAANSLIKHHEGLRLQLNIVNDKCQQFIVQANDLYPIIFYSCSYRIKSKAFTDFVENKVNKIQDNFTFPGELFKILVIESSKKNYIVVFIIHHLLTDVFSSRIIVRDFFVLYEANKKKQPYTLQHVISTLTQYSAYSTFYWNQQKAEVSDYWCSLPWQKVKTIPTDYNLSALSNIEDFTTLSMISIPAKKWEDRIRVNEYNTLEILLCSIGLAYHAWVKHDVLNIGLLFLGRENFTSDIDLSNTVGWFSEFIPILLQPNLPLETFLLNTKLQIQKANVIGKSFGVMKYLSENQSIEDEYKAFPEPQISLNFLLNFVSEDEKILNLPQLSNHYNYKKAKSGTERAFLLSGGAFFKDKAFHLSWDFSNKVFMKKTIDNFTNKCLEEFTRLSKMFNF